MHNIIVTLKSNVNVDSEGKFIENEDGSLSLIDPDDIGILAKTHVIQTLKLEDIVNVGKTLDSGYQTRCEIYWDLRRNPSPAMHKPTDLVWIELPSSDSDDEEEIEGEEIEGEEIESEGEVIDLNGEEINE